MWAVPTLLARHYKSRPVKLFIYLFMVAVKDNSPRFTREEYFAWEEQQLESRVGNGHKSLILKDA